MASILFTGNTSLLTQESLDFLLEQYKVVVTVDDAGKETEEKEGNLHVYHVNPMEEKFRRLFDAYSFEMVCYLSGYLDGGNGIYGEQQWLEALFDCCKEFEIEKFVLISTADSQLFTEKNTDLHERVYENDRAFCSGRIEELAKYFAANAGIKLITLWTPYLVNEENEGNFIGKIFEKIAAKENVTLPGAENEDIDFLTMKELCKLLYRIAEETEDETDSYYAISGYHHTWKDFSEKLRSLEKDKSREYIFTKKENELKLPAYPSKLRRKYGFIPVEDVLTDLKEYYDIYRRNMLQGKIVSKSFWNKVLQNSNKILKYAEMILVFLLAEFLAGYTSDSVYFKIVDVRLLYVIIMGAMHGLRIGVLAGLLECLVLLRKFAGEGVDAVTLFYNIENWIPFVYYLIAGSICGYLADKRMNETNFQKKENDLLREKYLFMNRVYNGVVENRKEYRRQILGFQDSFGKIFDAVQKLESDVTSEIFVRGLKIMEEILQNHAIAIYTLDSWQKFGRLAVCSNSQLSKLSKSVEISRYQEVYDTIRKGEVYQNTELKPGLPVYAYGVVLEGKVVLFIFVWEAEVEQYGIYYKNIFRILCGLVQNSFLRALEDEEFKSRVMYFDGTTILRPEYLKKVLESQEDMKIAGISDFVLVHFASKDKEELDAKLSGIVRSTDFVGADENGEIYLVLTQSYRGSFPVVAKRLEEHGIVYDLVEKEGYR